MCGLSLQPCATAEHVALSLSHLNFDLNLYRSVTFTEHTDVYLHFQYACQFFGGKKLHFIVMGVKMTNTYVYIISPLSSFRAITKHAFFNSLKSHELNNSCYVL